MSKQIFMTDLEAKILAGEDKNFGKDLISKLEEYAWQVKQELNRGLPLDEFSKLEKVKEAIEAGIRVLKKVCAEKDGLA